MNLAQDDFTRMTLALLEGSKGVLEPNHDPPEIQSDHIGSETWQDDNETDFDLSLMLNDDDEDSGSSCAEERPSTFTSSTDRFSLGGKRNCALGELIDAMVFFGNLKVVEGDQLLEYQRTHGYYHHIHRSERYIAKCLNAGGFLDHLSARDIHDTAKKILWHPACDSNIDQFNRYESLINTRDGILDFVTGEVQDHSPDYLFTYFINATYLEHSESITCPTFDHFCATSLAPMHHLDDETDRKIIEQKRRLLLEMIGYICCDSNAGKCALFLKGAPDSGKSVIVNFIHSFFDLELISAVQLHQLSDRFAKAELFGKKLNVSGEIQGKKLREITTFKCITGGDRIEAEYKGKDLFSFVPRCKLLFAGNTLPTTSESDATRAFVNRLTILLFNHSIPKEKQDKDLLDKLLAEKDAIFTLAMDALRALKERNYCFTLPDESKEFLNSFEERGNSLQAFLKDCCVVEAEARIFNADLYQAYVRYCQKNGLEEFSREKLYEMLSGVPGVTMKRIRIGNENRWGHVGIGIRDQT
jgi:putative DNA primase/helicase